VPEKVRAQVEIAKRALELKQESEPPTRRHHVQGRADALADEDSSEPDEFVPDPQVAREFNITLMTLWRWTNDPDLGFPAQVVIRKRNFRSRRQLETFKALLLRRAIAARSGDPGAA
jgi:hypothetical protein